MLKKNLALSVVYALTLAGLTACGGGSESGTEAPVAVPTPTPTPTPTSPVEPVVASGFANGVYTADVRGVTDVVILGDSLYLSSVDDNSRQVWARFDNVIDAVSENEIVDAAGFSISGNIAVVSAKFNANVAVNEAGLITKLGSVEIDDEFFGGEFVPSDVTMVTNLHQLNADWIEPDFAVFSIDSALTLTAKDKSGCDISGTLTAENNVFAAALDYTNCLQAGTYEGVLWAYEYDAVTYLSWIAFDSDNNVVSAKLDTFTSQQENLTLNGELTTQLYVNSTISSDDALIVHGNKLHYFKGTKGLKAGDFFVEYTLPLADANAVVAEGYGYTRSGNAVVAEMAIFAPTRKYSPFKGEITDKSTVAQIANGFSVAVAEKPLNNIKGTWGNLTIANNGSVKGTVAHELSTCDVSGTASDFVASTAEVSLTLSGCDLANTYTGAIAGFERDGKEALALLVFSYDEATNKLGMVRLLVTR